MLIYFFYNNMELLKKNILAQHKKPIWKIVTSEKTQDWIRIIYKAIWDTRKEYEENHILLQNAQKRIDSGAPFNKK